MASFFRFSCCDNNSFEKYIVSSYLGGVKFLLENRQRVPYLKGLMIRRQKIGMHQARLNRHKQLC